MAPTSPMGLPTGQPSNQPSGQLSGQPSAVPFRALQFYAKIATEHGFATTLIPSYFSADVAAVAAFETVMEAKLGNGVEVTETGATNGSCRQAEGAAVFSPGHAQLRVSSAERHARGRVRRFR